MKSKLIMICKFLNCLLLFTQFMFTILHLIFSFFNLNIFELLIFIILAIFVLLVIISIVFPLIVNWVWKVGTNDFGEMMDVGKNKSYVVVSIVTTFILIISIFICLMKYEQISFINFIPLVVNLLLTALEINTNGVKMTIRKYL